MAVEEMEEDGGGRGARRTVASVPRRGWRWGSPVVPLVAPTAALASPAVALFFFSGPLQQRDDLDALDMAG